MAVNEIMFKIFRNAGVTEEEFCRRVGENHAEINAIKCGSIGLKGEQVQRWADDLEKGPLGDLVFREEELPAPEAPKPLDPAKLKVNRT